MPYNDFIGIAISSQIENLHEDEYLIASSDFSLGSIPQQSKIMLRKTFVVSKTMRIKKYGTLSESAFKKISVCFVNILSVIKKVFILLFPCNAWK